MKHDLQKTVEITNKLFNLFYDKYQSSPYLPKLKIYFADNNLVYITYNTDEPTIIDITKVPDNMLSAIIYFFDKYFVYHSFGFLTISHFLDLLDDIFYEKGQLFYKKSQIETTIKGYEWGKFSDDKYFDRYTKEVFINYLLEKYV